MNVVLFGSLLNPLSAVAAQYLGEQNMLKLIVVAKSRCANRTGGINILSQICIGLYRYIHVFLRAIRVKRSKSYISLLEFMVATPSIPKVYFLPDSAEFERILNHKLKDLGLNECIGLSCIFPFKIPGGFIHIKRFLNVHPAELPANRGPNPYFWVLAHSMNRSAVTYHVLTSHIDAGPILYQEFFPVTSGVSEYKLEKITAEYLRRSLPVLFGRFEEFLTNAKPQENGIYYPQPSMSDREKYNRHSIFHVRDFIYR